MDFTKEEQRILLQALYRFRGDVSGASQSEQNKYALVESVIARIEEESGPLTAERTRFDREMEENLSVLARGGEWPSKAALDKEAAAPKVESRAGASAARAGAAKAAKRPAAEKKAAPAPRAGAAKPARREAAPKAAASKGARAKGARASGAKR
jgi:hypothetical protein